VSGNVSLRCLHGCRACFTWVPGGIDNFPVVAVRCLDGDGGGGCLMKIRSEAGVSAECLLI
jgi:hypothetical protein